jgi:hypothetical protein
MKQDNILLRLIEFANDHPFGNKQGRDVLIKLSGYIDDHEADIYEVSLDGIIATDASFPRESVISLAKMYKGEKGFFLTGNLSKDLLDNWHYAAIAKEQPLILITNDGYKVIGPEPKAGSKELLDFIMDEGEVTTAKIVQKFGGSAQNASAKLKKLFATGLILGRKTIAESGGLEFVYRAIK